MSTPATQLLPIDLPRICDALKVLADEVEFIANGGADDIHDSDAWHRRCRAGTQVLRLRTLLHGGQLDLADVEFAVVETLRNVWLTLRHLKYGNHLDRPESYAGALFLPFELDELNRIRSADDEFDSWDLLKLFGDQEFIDESVAELRRSRGGGDVKTANWTTKRDYHRSFISEIRNYISLLSRVPAEPTPPPAKNDDLPTVVISKNEASSSYHDVTSDDAGDNVTADELAKLVGLSTKRISNILSDKQNAAWAVPLKQGSGPNGNQYSYATILPGLRLALSAKRRALLPDKYAHAKAKLASLPLNGSVQLGS